MEMTESDYTRWYIVQALFKLMSAGEYDGIGVTDIAKKAGVGRATFYRYFKSKADVIKYYFERHTREFGGLSDITRAAARTMWTWSRTYSPRSERRRVR